MGQNEKNSCVQVSLCTEGAMSLIVQKSFHHHPLALYASAVIIQWKQPTSSKTWDSAP